MKRDYARLVFFAMGRGERVGCGDYELFTWRGMKRIAA